MVSDASDLIWSPGGAQRAFVAIQAIVDVVPQTSADFPSTGLPARTCVPGVRGTLINMAVSNNEGALVA